MHELSIMEGVMDMVRESAIEHNISKVSKLKLVIGKLTMVLPDSLQFSFEVLSQDELFRGAVLDIEMREIRILCKQCDQYSVLEDGYNFVCPACGANKVEIVNGRELYLDNYEGEDN